MELYEAHLILRAWYCNSYAATEYRDLALDRYRSTNGRNAKPFLHQLCRHCRTVHEAFTPLPIQDGCISCLSTGWGSADGSQQYSIVHGNVMFWLGKLSLDDHEVIAIALAQLYELQQANAQLEEVIL